MAVHRSAKFVFCSLVFLALGTSAHADDSKDVLSLAVGSGIQLGEAATGEPMTTSSNIRLGYEFNRLLGAELGYLDVNRSNIDIDSDAWSASLVVRLPMQGFDFYTRLGALRFLDTDSAHVRARGMTGASTQGFAAFGAALKLKKFDLYGEVSRIDPVSDSRFDLFSAGFRFRF